MYERVDGAWVERGTGISAMFGAGSPPGSQSASVAGTSVYATNLASGVTSTYQMTPLDTGTPDEESVQSVVSRLCRRAGLTDEQFDASDLSSITREVRALPIAQIAPVRQGLELLGSIYYFDMVVSDKVYFRPRGAAAVETIPHADLGAKRDGGWPEPLALRLANDLELPAQMALSYLNIDDDCQADTQYSDRLVSAASDTVVTVQAPIGLTPPEAKSIADAMLLDQAVAAGSTQVNPLCQ